MMKGLTINFDIIKSKLFKEIIQVQWCKTYQIEKNKF
jgi:hypothetical protein